MALRSGLFRSPDILSSLRCEAAERFVHWREVERTVLDVRKHNLRRERRQLHDSEDEPYSNTRAIWSKANWELEWEAALSQDVARRVREDAQMKPNPQLSPLYADSSGDLPFDPLHLPSLLIFSLSILGPFHNRLGQVVMRALNAIYSCNVKLAVVGGFCIGLGTGILLR